MYREIAECRVCGNRDLRPVVDLGTQCLTGVFPAREDEVVSKGPLELVQCRPGAEDACGLVQLRHTYQPDQLYGMNYGYRSGLNQSMVSHLRAKSRRISELVKPRTGDLILDIGSNDGTLLKAFEEVSEAPGLTLAGIDPTIRKFLSFYPPHIRTIPSFFSREVVDRELGGRQARVVTSIAMFYDLEAPLTFMSEVRDILAPDGVWVFEQSYLPTMLELVSYDTICQEHLEYYGLRQIDWMARRVGLKIVDLEWNVVNGGSFSVTVARAGSPYPECHTLVEKWLAQESELGSGGERPFELFRARVREHRDKLCGFLEGARSAGRQVLGYGASTKGNVILQYCGIGRDLVAAIAEVNPDKFGHYTPGTLIPIVSEAEARARRPDAFLVLPWHFRTSIVERESRYLAGGGELVFPLPAIEVVRGAEREAPEREDGKA